jgi:flagellar P-ring protein precursor FlgI
MTRLAKPLIAATVLALLLGLVPSAARAETRVKDVCRVKGQEQAVLHGLGLVVGLRGTGDGGRFLPAIRSLATTLELLGNPVGKGGPAELQDAKNIALVSVSVTIPAAGARQGDRLVARVASVGAAKSLEGGVLLLTPLQGPDRSNPRVFGFASGPITIDSLKAPVTGRVADGCILEEDFLHPFVKDGLLTLILDEHHADFEFAQELAEAINSELSVLADNAELARAVSQSNVVVRIPPQYESSPVDFVSQVMKLSAPDVRSQARVVINERSGAIVIGADVEIGAAVISHRNLVIETGAGDDGRRWLPVDPSGKNTVKLQALVEALNAVKTPPEDVIEIIRGLAKNGKLHGELIIE